MTLDEVSSLHWESSRQGNFTCFDFVAGDLRRRWVTIPGRHDIRPGMRLTVVLNDPSDWEDVQAWRFDDTNRILMSVPPLVGLIALCLLCAATAGLLGWLCFGSRSATRPTAGWSILAFVLASFAGGMYFAWRNSLAVMRVLAATPPQPPGRSKDV
ncbi:hypothetical protein [Ralstonia pseudosolanacearum]|uniref:hypothetical protein n=1 Tax=Ralstonia pseudosolanacearum TaxID=1310165 RepID=UPI0018675BD2|nr:hypothetical protein [Ralstonia pseudosolanacearum]QOK93071.1 hypothetical protein HF908_17285 [Ralstonia pseudosolanacearum]UWD90772.1 hypothetical protein NY025_24625 [Ralstonia pseudosolanacearum]CAH0443024.1 hypothetical protein LMG9673_03839 [Ralstonia pseudosolanacearum]